MHARPELDLIADCQTGDMASISELFERYYSASLRVARSILRSEEEAQDAVQSAFLAAFLHLGSYRGEASFKTWITRIVVNRCLMEVRSPARRLTRMHWENPDKDRDLDMLPSRFPTPETSAWCGELASAHSQAMAKLPDGLRDAYVLYATGLSIREVAAQLRLTLAAAKTRVFRARAGLRWLLQPVWTGEKSNAPCRVEHCQMPNLNDDGSTLPRPTPREPAACYKRREALSRFDGRDL
jgi:RNA polymerase sigma-70 factor (ECF subfamily)